MLENEILIEANKVVDKLLEEKKKVKEEDASVEQLLSLLSGFQKDYLVPLEKLSGELSERFEEITAITEVLADHLLEEIKQN